MYSTKFPGFRPFVPGTPRETMPRGDLRGQFYSIQLAFDRLFKSNKACSIAGRNNPPAFWFSFVPRSLPFGRPVWSFWRDREGKSFPAVTTSNQLWHGYLEAFIDSVGGAPLCFSSVALESRSFAALELLLFCFRSFEKKLFNSMLGWSEFSGSGRLTSSPGDQGWGIEFEGMCVWMCKEPICSIRKCKIYFTLNPPLTSNRMIERLWNYWSKNECIPLICLSELEWLVGLVDYSMKTESIGKPRRSTLHFRFKSSLSEMSIHITCFQQYKTCVTK